MLPGDRTRQADRQAARIVRSSYAAPLEYAERLPYGRQVCTLKLEEVEK